MTQYHMISTATDQNYIICPAVYLFITKQLVNDILLLAYRWQRAKTSHKQNVQCSGNTKKNGSKQTGN